jgi:hypothetical protein
LKSSNGVAVNNKPIPYINTDEKHITKENNTKDISHLSEGDVSF